jgi:S1-C subfamily serine protease
MTATILPFERPLQDALYTVHAIVPDSAVTADLLGTERHSHAVQVSPQGHLLTVSYSVMEASEVWLTNRKGQTAEAIVLANDYDSGIALLRPSVPLGSHYLETVGVDALQEGDTLQILIAEERETHPVKLAAIQEFAGRWEYLLERALYTTPLFERWSGSALLTGDGKLCGIGSLALGIRPPGEAEPEPANLFIPVELVMPHLEHMSLHGQKPGRLRPWLGALVEEHEAALFIVGIYHNAPAARAGLQPGEVILSVGQQPVSTMAEFFRSLWHYGPAGTAIPLTVSDGNTAREVLLDSTDRESYFLRHTAEILN